MILMVAAGENSMGRTNRYFFLPHEKLFWLNLLVPAALFLTTMFIAADSGIEDRSGWSILMFHPVGAIPSLLLIPKHPGVAFLSIFSSCACGFGCYVACDSGGGNTWFIHPLHNVLFYLWIYAGLRTLALLPMWVKSLPGD